MDDFNAGVVKSIIHENNVFNNSLYFGVFPSKLKSAKVTPIYKSGDHSD